MNLKQRAAEAALHYVKNDSVIGLGSGSTAECFLIALAEALRAGKLRNVRGVATSEQTARQSRDLGIALVPLSQAAPLTLTIDGADEVSPQLDLIKGLGGALLREKLVAQNSDRLIIIADSSKRVDKLGVKSPVPVEVAQFEHEMTATFLRSLGCDATLRAKNDGTNYMTDNGNLIYDCRFPGGIDDPAGLNAKLQDRAGVVESGLFLKLASMALIAGAQGVDTLTR